MNKKYLLVTTFLVGLVLVGAYFIFKIPSQPLDEPLQDGQLSDNIESTDTKTLGAEVTPMPEESNVKEINMDTDKLIIQDVLVGTGVEAVSGKKITVNYTGYLTSGSVFDSNVNPSFGHVEPFTFNLGSGEVIQGWDQGFNGMKVGGKRKLTIPPSLGYGAQSVGSIPANSTLVFEVELLGVE